MFNEDMILSSRSGENKTNGPAPQDRLGYLFLNVLLAFLLSAGAGGVIEVVAGFAGLEEHDHTAYALHDHIIQAMRSGVFTAVLMAHPWVPAGTSRPVRIQAAYAVAGLILGIALQFFIITPYAAVGPSIFAYMLILMLVLPIWMFGKTLDRIVAPIIHSWPVRMLISLFRRKKTDE